MLKRNDFAWLELGARASTLLAVTATIASVVGCGGSGGAPVSGTVTLDGQPLAGAQVLFESTEPSSEDGAASTMFFGTTDEQGHYELKVTGEEWEGAPPGEYRVKISTAVVSAEANELTPTPPERVPMEYRDGSHTFVVPEGGSDSADFAMQSK